MASQMASRFEVSNIITGIHAHFRTRLEAAQSAVRLAAQMEKEILPVVEMVVTVYDRLGRIPSKRTRHYTSKGYITKKQFEEL